MNTAPGIKNSTTNVVNNIHLDDIFNLQDSQRFQNLLPDSSGVASIIAHPDETPVSKSSIFCRICNNIIRKTEKGLALLFILILLVATISVTGQQLRSGKRVYKVAINKDYEPYEYLNEENKADGYTPSLLKEIGKSAEVTFEFIPMTWNEVIPALEQGEVDLVSMTYTPERAASYDFSQPHSQTTQALFHTNKAAHIVDLSSLTGHSVGFQENHIALMNLENRTDFKKLIFNSKLDGLMQLNMGKIDAFFCDQQTGINIIAKYNLTNVNLVSGGLFSRKYAFATRKGNHQLIDLLNTQLSKLRDSGKLQELKDAWLSRRLYVPSWIEINLSLLLTLGGILSSALILLVLWSRSLQRRVIDKTKSLRASEEKYRLITEKISDVVWLMDMNGKSLFVSQSIEKFTGYTVDEYLAQTISDRFTADSAALAIESLKVEAFLYSTPEVPLRDYAKLMVLEYWCKDGSAKTGEVLITPYFDDHDSLIGLHGVTRDITERKQTEDALRESESQLTETQSIAKVGSWTTDLTNLKVRWSKEIFRIFEIEPDSFQSSHQAFLEFVHPEDRANVDAAFALSFDNHSVNTIEHRILTPGGKIKFVEEHWQIISDHEGKPIRAFGSCQDITEHKQAEQALYDSDLKYQTLAQISPVGIFRTDATGTTMFVNPKYCQISGLSANEAFGDGWLSAVHPDDREKLKADWIDSVHDHNTSLAEYRFVRADGSIVWVMGNTVQEKNAKDETVGYIGTITDISERKRVEETLQNERLLLRTVIDNIPDAIYTKGLDSRITLGNLTVLQYMGAKSESEVLGRDDFDFYPKELAQQFFADDQSVIQKGIPVLNREEFIYDENQKKRWLLTSKLPLRDKNNQIIGLVGIGRDITERKVAEIKLRKLSRAIEQSPVSILITDTNGEIEYVNPKLLEISGYQLEEVIGRNPRILSSGEKPKGEYKVLWDTILSGKKWCGEFQNKKKNGDLYWENATISPIINETGEISHFIAVEEDITDRKKMIGELIKAKEKAEESDRLKSAFLANMSHEIRTPMNGILGFAELLKEPDLTGEIYLEYIGIIEQSGNRMVNIINDIVDISKIESGQMKISVSETNVNELMEFIADFFKPEAEQKGIQFTLKNTLPANAVILKTDKEKLYAVLTNLVKNAIKFTKNGSIEIGYGVVETHVRASLQEPASVHDFAAVSEPGSTEQSRSVELQFYVKDTGIGIRPDQKEFIFERFRQGSETLNRSYEGAGLGLSISKAFVEMLGGRIWVESEFGIGSVFYFTLPHGVEPVEKNVANTMVLVDSKDNQVNNLKILIVDDDEGSEKLMSIAVRKFGKDILKARTGVEAVEACRNNPDIDLVLMDIQMPEMDGYEATRRIRQFNQEVVIIAQTAFALEGDREKAMEAGCTDYISKPIRRDKLIAIMHKYFQN